MIAKPHWKRTFVREEDGVRTITMSAVVPHADAPGGELRVWMDECWQLPASDAGEKTLITERTSYWCAVSHLRYATLERCLEEAYAPQPAHA